MSDITRSESIKQLHRLKADITNGLAFVSKTKDKHLDLESLDMAIKSLETDEAYQLEYEQPEFCVDCISRKRAIISITACDGKSAQIEALKKLPSVYPENTVSLSAYKQVAWERDIAIQQLHELGYEFGQKIEPTTKNDLSSGLKNGSPIIDWNNCHTSEQLDSISTTKNDLAVDCISRQAVIDMTGLSEWFDSSDSYNEFVFALNELSPVKLQEPKTGHWNEIPKYKDVAWQCSECEHFTTWKHKYCPNCGAKMIEPQESEEV